jgi:hypothetical protein
MLTVLILCALACDDFLPYEHCIGSNDSCLMLLRKFQYIVTTALIAITLDITRAGPQLIQQQHNDINGQLLKVIELLCVTHTVFLHAHHI